MVYKIEKEPERWKIEIEGFKFIIEDFEIRNQQHWIVNPMKAIGYFYVNNNIYGIRNLKKPLCKTVEDFYKLLQKQKFILKPSV